MTVLAQDDVHARDSGGSVWMMGAASLLIAVGTVANNSDAASLAVILAGLVTLLAVLYPSAGWLPSIGDKAVALLMAAAVGLSVLLLPTRAPIDHPAYVPALLALGLLALHAVVFPKHRTLKIGIVSAAYVLVMSWMVALSGVPDIDVYAFQQEGAAALLSGVNPFALTFDISVSPGSPYYSPDVIENGRLSFGFIYPPLSLLMAVPGYVLGGDYRYGLVIAIAVAAVIVSKIRAGTVATGAAMMLLFAPTTQQVLYWGWTDPFVILFLAIAAWYAVRQLAATPYAIGLLIALKQYMAPLLLLVPVLLVELRRQVGLARLMLLPIFVVAVTVLPFALWDFGALIYSTVSVHLLQPFRADSYSIPALLVRAGYPELPALLGFAAAVAAVALVVWRGTRSVAGMCAGLACVLAIFFLLGKQAFMHYYYLVMALLLCGIAAADLTGREVSSRAPESLSLAPRSAVDAE